MAGPDDRIRVVYSPMQWLPAGATDPEAVTVMVAKEKHSGDARLHLFVGPTQDAHAGTLHIPAADIERMVTMLRAGSTTE